MKIAEIRSRLEAGERLLVTVSVGVEGKTCYNLSGGGTVSPAQFEALRKDMRPADRALFDDCSPVSYEWSPE